jgi:hypothetical protein
MFLPGDVFGTVPMFFLSTDVEENDSLSRAITHRLYDQDHLRRIAQYIILGAGGARLLDELGVDPDVWHLNEAHGLSAAFHLYEKHHSLEEVKKRLVFTTHTPEEAGNERHDFNLLRDFSFFGGVPEEKSAKSPASMAMSSTTRWPPCASPHRQRRLQTPRRGVPPDVEGLSGDLRDHPHHQRPEQKILGGPRTRTRPQSTATLRNSATASANSRSACSASSPTRPASFSSRMC